MTVLPRSVDARTAGWLVDALAPGRRPGTWQDDPAGPPPDLGVAAQLHGVEGWVRRRAASLGIDLPGVDDAVRSAVARHQRALGDLRATTAALGEFDWLVVKGPALTALHGGDPDLRSYVDLDVLVRPADVGHVVNSMRDNGFELLDRNWPVLQRQRVHELRMLAPSGGAIDLHWSLGVGGPDPRADTSPRVDDLLGRAVDVEGLGGVRTVGWADTVVHLAVHAAGSGGHRLIWLADLRAALAGHPTTEDAHRLAVAAREWQAGPALHLMLGRVRRLLGHAPPPGPRPVRSAAWRGLVAAAERLSPVERQGTGSSICRVVARSCRADARTSTVELVRRGSAWWRGGRRDPLGPADLLDPRDPGSALYPAGGDGAEERFFADLARRNG